MQKKLLACLLVTPVATAAVANTAVSDFNPNEASTDATQEGFKLDFGADGVGLYAPVGIYTVKFKEINLYPGTYELNLGEAKNILVKVDGADVTVGADGIAEFEIKETKDVEITLNADNREIAFSCTKAELTVIVNETELNSDLTTALGSALPVELTEDNTNQTPQSLKDEYADLKKRYDDIAAEIAKIVEPVAIADYGTFELWKGAENCTIGVEIAALKADVEAYNEKANAENTAVADRNANKEYWDRQNNQIKAYESKIDPYAAETDEFVKARTQEALDVVNGMIAKLNAELEAKKDFAEKFETPEGCDYSKVMAAFGELEAAKNTAVADKAAYGKYVAEMKKFTETYNGVLNALNLPADVDGKEGDAFLTTRRNATAEATKIYEGLYVADLAEKLTAADATNEEINEAALNAKISALTAAATEMTTVKTNFEALAKAENDAYGTYKTALGSKQPVSGLLGSYEEAKATKVPDGQDAEYEKLTKAVEDAFGDLEKFVTTHYGIDLSTTDNQTEYNRLVKAVEDAISALKTNTDNYADWNKLVADLNTNDGKIKTLSNALKTYVESKDKEVTIDLYSKFKPTIDNIQASIEQLKPGDDASEIETAIGDVLKAAQNLDEAFRKAFDAYIGFSGDLAAYKTFIDNKFIFEKDGKPVYGKTNAETKYDDLAKVVDGYKKELNEVAGFENQKCLEGALALADKIGESTFEADLEKAKKDFAYNASVANKNYAQGVYNATETNYNKLEAAGVPDIDAANLGALTTEKDNAVAKVTEDASPEDLTGADRALKTLVDNCTKFDNNVNAYAALYEVVKDVPTDIEEALKFEGDCYTIDPAKAHFTEVLNGYKADYDKFMADIKTALEGMKVVDGLPDKGTVKGFTTRANELTGNIKTVKERIQENQQVYDALLDESKNTLAVINGVRNFLDTNYDKENEAYNSYMAQLDALADELTALNLAVTGDFGKGELDKVNEKEYTDKYEDIAERAKNLQTEIDGAVSGLNEATAAGWKPAIDKARSVKDAAVRVYNDYYWDIDNEGYHDFVKDVLAKYRDLYDYTKKISDLDAEFNEWVEEQNNDRVVFSQDDYKVWTDKIEAIETEIANREQKLVDDMNAKGGEYWTKEYTNRASLVYDEMKGALLLAGMATEKDGVLTLSADLAGTSTGKVFEDAIAAMPKAIADKAKADNAESGVKNYASQIGLAMDAIADELDKIKYTADQLEAAAKVHLATLYNDFTGYATEAKTEAGKADLVAAERIEKAIADIEAQETAAADAYEGIENAFDALRYTQADPFKDFADAIKNILDKLNEESEANVASKKLYDDYTGDGGYIPSLNSDLDALKAYAASMAAYSKTTDAIAAAEAAVNVLAEFVETNKATLSKDECKTEAETLKGEADKAIEDGYAAVRTAETEVLAGLIKDVRVAFDNAKAMSEPAWDQEKAAVYEAKINAAMAEYAALDGKTDEEFQTAALKLENDLCTCLSDLEKVYNHDGTSAANARAELDKAYNPVKGNIETSDDMEGFEEEVKSEYAGKYQALSEKLGDIKERYDGDDAVVVREANYLAEIKAVQAELDALNAEAAQADQEAKYNKDVAANASALAAELAGYQVRYDALLAYTQQHKLYEEGNSDNYYWNQLNNAAWYIEYETQWLADSQKEDAAEPLTPASVLPYRNNLNNILNYVDYNAHYQVVNIAYSGALTALDNAAGALADAHLVPADRTKLQNDYDTAYLNFNKAIQDYNDTYNTLFPNNYFDWEKLGEYVKAVDTAEQAFNDVETASQAIIDAIGELHFIPGDVEADPDHEVSAVDVQQVIAWIGEDMTFDDLVASSPRQAYAADVNGDSKINIADVVAISNIILNDLNNPSQAPRLLVKGVQTAAENNLTVALGETVDGVREYAVMINNTTAFVGGQLDINVGAGMEIVDIELTERGADHKLYRFDNNSGARVVIASMANDELRGNSGAMLIVRTRGAGNLTVGNAVFADINATAYGLAGEGMSAIDSIGESFRNAKERIYNVAGQALDRIQRGVNIIRKSDGTTTKEMH
jgi:DNA-directed RNA polymerase subunit L